MLDSILFFVVMLLAGLVGWLGYKTAGHRIGRFLVPVVMALLALLFLFFGGLTLAVGLSGLYHAPQMIGVGGLLFSLGMLGVLLLIPVVRRLIATHLLEKFNPASWPHAWQLFLFGLTTLFSAFFLTILYDPYAMIEALRSIPSLPILAAVNAMVFVLFSYLVLGAGARTSWKAVGEEMGLTRIAPKTIWVMLGLALVLVVIVHFAEQLLMPLVQPDMQLALKQIGEAMQARGPAAQIAGSALVIGLSAGIGEEILFRGAMQPMFGLVPTAMLFALIHLHYGPTVLLLILFGLGLVLGWVRKRYNTTAAIIVHAGFDFFALVSPLFLHS